MVKLMVMELVLSAKHALYYKKDRVAFKKSLYFFVLVVSLSEAHIIRW